MFYFILVSFCIQNYGYLIKIQKIKNFQPWIEEDNNLVCGCAVRHGFLPKKSSV